MRSKTLKWIGGRNGGDLLVVYPYPSQRLKLSMAQKGKYCLVRWVDEETVSVVLTTSVREEQRVEVAGIYHFKWSGKYYKGEVLKISGIYYAHMYTCNTE